MDHAQVANLAVLLAYYVVGLVDARKVAQLVNSSVTSMADMTENVLVEMMVAMKEIYSVDMMDILWALQLVVMMDYKRDEQKDFVKENALVG